MDKVVYSIKKEVFYISIDSEVYLYDKEKNLYIFKLNIEEHKRLFKIIEFLKYFKSFEEIKGYMTIDEITLKRYLEIIKDFIETRKISKHVLIVGDTKLNEYLTELLSQDSVLVENIKEDSNTLDHLKAAEQIKNKDFIIINQNLYISPMYTYMNNLCRELEIPVLNVLVINNAALVGPILGKRSNVCFDCYKKRIEINNINIKTNYLAAYFEKDKDNYEDNRYSKIYIKDTIRKLAESVKYILESNKHLEYLKDDGIISINLDDFKNDNYKLFSIPFCNTCNNEDKLDLYNEKELIKREETCNLQLDFINSTAGMFRKLINSKTILLGKEIYYYTIQISSIFKAINNYDNYDSYEKYQYNIAGGVSINKNFAMGKAIGEACERYCLEAYKVSSLKKYSMNELESRKIQYLKNINLFADWQYKIDGFIYKKPSKDSEIFWTDAKDLINDEEIYVPAGFIYSRYKRVNEKNCIGKLTTSGAACSTSFEDAVYYGILELIERDCTMITWLQRLAVPKIDLSNVKSKKVKEMIKLLESNGVKIDLFYITLDLKIPCVLAIGKSENPELPFNLIGAGCRFNIDSALVRALEEVIQGCGWTKLNKNIKNFDPGDNYVNVRGFRERVSLYAYEKMSKELDFLFDSKNTVRIENIETYNLDNERAYKMCKNILKEKNMTLIAKDITTYDVNQIGSVVVKVLIPELQQIEGDYNYRYLNNKRTYEVPKKLGYKNVEQDSRLYNKAPHPFP